MKPQTQFFIRLAFDSEEDIENFSLLMKGLPNVKGEVFYWYDIDGGVGECKLS